MGGPIVDECSEDVETNSRPQARVGDKLTCVIPDVTNFVVTGSGTVEVNGRAAARQFDRTMHPPPGLIVTGSGDVEIGGPTVGGELGGSKAGTTACLGMAAGRNKGGKGQSYSNCGIESSRQIIRQATGSKIGEDDLLKYAVAQGHASGSTAPNKIAQAGGSWPDQRERLLNEKGVPAERIPSNMNNIAQAVAEGKGVQVDIWAGNIWPPQFGFKPGTGAHVILVTGLKFDENGELTDVLINDTGAGDCGRSLPAATLEGALMPGRQNDLVVTKDPIW